MRDETVGKALRVRLAGGGLALVLLVSASGCFTFDTAGLAACSGSYTGTFSGAGGGTVSGSLSGGSLNLTFTASESSSLNVQSFSYHVSNITGDFTGTNPNDVSASFDTGSCRMSGFWTYQGASGVWTATIVRP